MVRRFMTMHYSHVTGGGFHYYWVFYSKQDIPVIRGGCPLNRPLTRSVMTRVVPDSQMNEINPEEFFSYCCRDGGTLGKVLVVPGDAKVILPEKGWRLIEQERDLSWDYATQAELLDRSAIPDFTNLVIVSKSRNHRVEYGSKEELERKRKDDVASERYDDYWYEQDEEGNLWCNGISMKEDMDSCYDYQESHLDECRNCTSLCRVHL